MTIVRSLAQLSKFDLSGSSYVNVVGSARCVTSSTAQTTGDKNISSNDYEYQNWRIRVYEQGLREMDDITSL